LGGFLSVAGCLGEGSTHDQGIQKGSMMIGGIKLKAVKEIEG
jgi:hypothetical protein